MILSSHRHVPAPATAEATHVVQYCVVDRLAVRRGTRTVFDAVSFTLRSGEFTGLIGGNGAGKSTLLRAMAGTLEPSQGRVHLHGVRVSEALARGLARLRALMPQHPGIGFDMTVAQVVRMGRAPWEPFLTDAEHQAVVEQCLADVGLHGWGDRLDSTLSGGERQRVHLARAMAQLRGPEQQPVWLFADEPVSAQDPRESHRVLALLRSLSRQGVGVVAALHDIQAVARYCDRVLVLHAGRLRADGPPGEVLTSALLGEVFGIEAEWKWVVDDRTGRRVPLLVVREPVETDGTTEGENA
jgi:iron complex transport system ATP-binding protein